MGEALLERLAGLSSGASVYRSLARLADHGLAAAVRPPVRPGHAPQLWYLTELGLAVVALDQGVEPEPLARRNRLREDDLLALARIELSHRALPLSQPGQGVARDAPNAGDGEHQPRRARNDRRDQKQPKRGRAEAHQASYFDASSPPAEPPTASPPLSEDERDEANTEEEPLP